MAGVTVIASSTAAVTVRLASPLMPWKVALIVQTPTASAAARPVVGSIEQMLAGEEVQLAELVRSWLVPSVKRPVPVTATGCHGDRGDG
jgi:hypothetical protein